MIMENTPLIETKRLILRKFTMNDAQDALALFGDEQVNTFLPWYTVKSLKEAEAFLQNNFLSCYQNDIAYNYAVALKTNNKVVGYVNVHDVGVSNDFGYGLRKEFWHQGIITEACLGVIDKLRQSALPFITATHDVNNPRSGEVMKKLGMAYKYSYEEQCQPKNILVIFKMYQLNFDDTQQTYMGFWDKYQKHWV